MNREIPVGGGEIPVVGRDIPVAVGKGILAEGTVEGKLPVIRVEGVADIQVAVAFCLFRGASTLHLKSNRNV